MSAVETQQMDGFVEGGDSFVLDADQYADLSVAARLRDIKLIRSKYMVKPELFDALEGATSGPKIKHGFSGELSACHFDQEDGIAIGQYRWIAEVKAGKRKVLKLTAEYLVAYTGLENFDEGHVAFFFEKIGRFATYPYFRAVFSQQSAASGVMLPPLPSLNERVD